MSADTPRTRIAIMTELHQLTEMMHEKREDADFLILSVEKRQDLMDEYDALDLYNRDEPEPKVADQLEIKRLVQEIIKLDAAISQALEKHKAESKSTLATSTAKQKILGYTNNAMSSSGTYMDSKL